MTDNHWRRALKRVARFFFEIDLAATRRWLRRRGQTPYALGGECRRCAYCCEAPGIQAGRLVWHMPRLRSLFLFWQRAVNGFELVERDPARRVFVFRCTHFDPVARTCDSYDSRPGICRDYPRALLYQAAPDFFPGCGYRPVAPNARGLNEALARLPLDSEQRQKLARGLHLDE